MLVGQFLEIAATVLKIYNRPMKPREIVDIAQDNKLFSDKLAGKTPHQTMKAKIAVDIRSKGSNSKFVRTAPNTFYLRELLTDSAETYRAPRQTPVATEELVLTFPSSALSRFGPFQGITRKWRPFLDSVLSDELCQPIPRLEAEHRDDHKQLLTYVLVTHRNHLLCFRRGTFNRAEDYLRGSLCIGFGGHVSYVDQTLYNRNSYREIIFDNAVRELHEELRLPLSDKLRLSRGTGLEIVGLLNDDSSPTGRRHFAVVLKYEVSDATEWERPARGEKSITQLRWLSLDTFDVKLRDFEYWSQLCLLEFFKGAVRTQPTFAIRRKAPFRKDHILCIVGGVGSGKSSATEILTRECGYVEINSGRVMANLLGVPPIPKTARERFQSLPGHLSVIKMVHDDWHAVFSTMHNAKAEEF